MSQRQASDESTNASGGMFAALREAAANQIAAEEERIASNDEDTARRRRKIADIKAGMAQILGGGARPAETVGEERRAPSAGPSRPEKAEAAAPQEIEDLPEPLRPYARLISGKSRSISFNSSAMVLDVLASLGGPATRKQILASFFERFPEDSLARVWTGGAEGAVSVALRRVADPSRANAEAVKLEDGRYALKPETT